MVRGSRDAREQRRRPGAPWRCTLAAPTLAALEARTVHATLRVHVRAVRAGLQALAVRQGHLQAAPVARLAPAFARRRRVAVPHALPLGSRLVRLCPRTVRLPLQVLRTAALCMRLRRPGWRGRGGGGRPAGRRRGGVHAGDGQNEDGETGQRWSRRRRGTRPSHDPRRLYDRRTAAEGRAFAHGAPRMRRWVYLPGEVRSARSLPRAPPPQSPQPPAGRPGAGVMTPRTRFYEAQCVAPACVSTPPSSSSSSPLPSSSSLRLLFPL